MDATVLNQGNTLSTIFRVSRYVIKKQRQLLLIGGLLLWVLNLWLQRGMEQTVGPEMAAELQANGQELPAEFFQDGRWASLVPHLPTLWLMGLVMIIIYLLIHITVTLKVLHTVENKELSLEQTISLAWHKLRPYIWTSILQGICLLGLFILLIIPGLIFAVFWYFTLYIVVYYGKTGMGAMKESKSIVTGRWWKTLWYMLLIGIISALAIGVIVALISALVGMLGDPVIASGITQLISYIMQLLILVVMTVFFLRRDKTRITAPQSA